MGEIRSWSPNRKIRGWTKSNKADKKLNEILYDSDISNVKVSIQQKEGKWFVYYYDYDNDDYDEELREYNTKKEAIDYAIKYMKRRPRGYLPGEQF